MDARISAVSSSWPPKQSICISLSHGHKIERRLLGFGQRSRTRINQAQNAARRQLTGPDWRRVFHRRLMQRPARGWLTGQPVCRPKLLRAATAAAKLYLLGFLSPFPLLLQRRRPQQTVAGPRARQTNHRWPHSSLALASAGWLTS